MGLFAQEMKTLDLPKLDLGKLGRRYMNPMELECLIALIRDHAHERIVEFGVNNGRTAKVLMENVPGIKLYIGVDVPPGYVTEKTVQRGEVPGVAGELVRDDPRVLLLVPPEGSHDLCAEDIGLIDAAFIDGDHSTRGVLQDTGLALANVRPGGILIWHDFHDLGTVDVRKVVDALAQKWGIRFIRGTWLAYIEIPRKFTESDRNELSQHLQTVRANLINNEEEKA